MGDRICIKLADEDEFSPVFYGHLCGLGGLLVMIKTLEEPRSTMGNTMCNFIVNIMRRKPHEYYFEIWNNREGETAADFTSNSYY